MGLVLVVRLGTIRLLSRIPGRKGARERPVRLFDVRRRQRDRKKLRRSCFCCSVIELNKEMTALASEPGPA